MQRVRPGWRIWGGLLGVLLGAGLAEAQAPALPPGPVPVQPPGPGVWGPAGQASPPTTRPPAPAILGAPQPAPAPGVTPAQATETAPLPPAWLPARPQPFVQPAPPASGTFDPQPWGAVPQQVAPPGGPWNGSGPVPFAVPPPAPPPPIFINPQGAPSFFFGLELQVVQPVVQNDIQATVPLPSGQPFTFAVPDADLDWTVSPRFELGYRLPCHQGLFALGYRFLVSEGTAGVEGMDYLRSRLNVNVVDFDYGNGFPGADERYQFDWRIGARLTSVFLDTQQTTPWTQAQASNNFLGAGPHASFDVRRRLAFLPGLALHGRIDGTVSVGQIEQHFSQNFLAADGTPLSLRYDPMRETRSVPILALQPALSYTPPGLPTLRLDLGYTYERWWYLGDTGSSQADLSIQGLFLRGQWDF